MLTCVESGPYFSDDDTMYSDEEVAFVRRTIIEKVAAEKGRRRKTNAPEKLKYISLSCASTLVP